MEIRRANKKDINRILDLLSQVLEVHAKLRPDLFVSGTTKYSKDQLSLMVEDDNNPIYVAIMDDEVVGYAMCQTRVPTSNMYPKKIFHLDDLCVDEKHREKHIGKTLFEYVVNEAKNRDCYEITLNSWPDNVAAQNFYKKMGTKVRSIVLEYIIDK